MRNCGRVAGVSCYSSFMFVLATTAATTEAPGLSSILREDIMADDKTKRGRQDRDRIDVNEDYELRSWSKKFGVTQAELKKAVQKVGPSAIAVKKELGK